MPPTTQTLNDLLCEPRVPEQPSYTILEMRSLRPGPFQRQLQVTRLWAAELGFRSALDCNPILTFSLKSCKEFSKDRVSFGSHHDDVWPEHHGAGRSEGAWGWDLTRLQGSGVSLGVCGCLKGSPQPSSGWLD